MSTATPSLHTYLDACLREAFGQPSRTLGKDDHWRLQSSPEALPVNLLVNGTSAQPAIWVFDSHDRADGVFSQSITEENQVGELIIQIQRRVHRAASPPAPGPEAAAS